MKTNRHKGFFLLLLLVCTLWSCKQEVVDKPENLIPEQVMVNIYYEVALLNAASGSDNTVMKKHQFDPEQFIYSKYAIDSLQLAQSSIYYASHPDIHLRIFQAVDKKMQELKNAADQKVEKRAKEMNASETLQKGTPKEGENP